MASLAVASGRMGARGRAAWSGTGSSATLRGLGTDVRKTCGVTLHRGGERHAHPAVEEVRDDESEWLAREGSRSGHVNRFRGGIRIDRLRVFGGRAHLIAAISLGRGRYSGGDDLVAASLVHRSPIRPRIATHGKSRSGEYNGSSLKSVKPAPFTRTGRDTLVDVPVRAPNPARRRSERRYKRQRRMRGVHGPHYSRNGGQLVWPACQESIGPTRSRARLRR